MTPPRPAKGGNSGLRAAYAPANAFSEKEDEMRVNLRSRVEKLEMAIAPKGKIFTAFYMGHDQDGGRPRLPRRRPERHVPRGPRGKPFNHKSVAVILAA
jgi:hypothetical protein